jgi:hypothetical protein
MIHMIFLIVPFNLARVEDKKIADPANPSDLMKKSCL